MSNSKIETLTNELYEALRINYLVSVHKDSNFK